MSSWTTDINFHLKLLFLRYFKCANAVLNSLIMQFIDRDAVAKQPDLGSCTEQSKRK